MECPQTGTAVLKGVSSVLRAPQQKFSVVHTNLSKMSLARVSESSRGQGEHTHLHSSSFPLPFVNPTV